MSTAKTELSLEKVQKSIDLIVKISESMTKVIPGDLDDKIVAILKQFAEQPWFAELVLTLIDAFSPDKPISKDDAIKLVSAALNK
jgi:hypothetical protein